MAPTAPIKQDAVQDEDTHRTFYDLEQHNPTTQTKNQVDLSTVAQNVVGSGEAFSSPFGERRIVYADWIASGRAYEPIESYIHKHVLPLYANTHTTTSATGLQSTSFRDEARQIIQQSVNANTIKDIVLFTGSGATGAVNKLVNVLGLSGSRATQNMESDHPSNRPVVFVGPHEHHSNLLPWRESYAEVVQVKDSPDGSVDQTHLAELLASPLYSNRPLKIGSFTACSNVTGLITDVDAVTVLLHKHGALSFWDYACAGPYLDIDMNPVRASGDADRAFVHKDAIFLSPHKLLGGVNSPGVLIAKKALFANAVPSAPNLGGGTVFFVQDESQRYLSNRVEREEGGTPDVLGAIRAGLAFRLKDSIGAKRMEQIEQQIYETTAKELGEHPRVALLGWQQNKQNASTSKHVAVFSFLIRHGDNGLFLHYNFVSALLNDLYGIQTRGGCMCAGPYALRLLGITDSNALALEHELAYTSTKCEYLRPGFTRFSFPCFVGEEERKFVVNAVLAIAEHGWRMLPEYRFNHRTGEWKHRTRMTKYPGRRWLTDADLFTTPATASADPAPVGPLTAAEMLSVGAAALELMKAVSPKDGERLADQTKLLTDEQARLCWFVLPSEAQAQLRSEISNKTSSAEPTSRVASVKNPRVYYETIAREAFAGFEKEITSAAVARASADQDITLSDAASGLSPVSSPLSVPPTVTTDTAADSISPSTSAPSTSSDIQDGAVCDLPDGQCFLPRKKDKYPVRQVNDVGAQAKTEAATNAQTSAALSGKAKMDAATLFPTPPKRLMKAVGAAVMSFKMIQEGDRLMLGLSGGKDSLTLLHVLLAMQKKAPIKFDIGACTIDPGTDAFDPSPLIPYMKSLGVEYIYSKQDIFADARSGSMKGNSICSFCARMKRGALYSAARKNNYNVLVLAQHLDDFAESFMMSAFHNGSLVTMKAAYTEAAGDIRVIRPLAFAREDEMKEFAYDAKLPVINENCPACFEAPQERARIKKLLAKEEALKPQLFNNLKRAIIPLMDPEIIAVLSDNAKSRTAKKGRPGQRQKGSKQSKKRGNDNQSGVDVVAVQRNGGAVAEDSNNIGMKKAKMESS